MNAAGTIVVNKNTAGGNDTANGVFGNPSVFLQTESTTTIPTNDGDLHKVALALSQSSAMTNKRGYDYNAAARAWLSGMGYSAAEEQRIINLSLEIAFNNLSSKRLLNDGIADIAAKYSGANINAKSVA